MRVWIGNVFWCACGFAMLQGGTFLTDRKHGARWLICTNPNCPQYMKKFANPEVDLKEFAEQERPKEPAD